MIAFLKSLAIGLVSGMLSGAFGIGGGIITTPAIKLILGAGDLVAVGTPLPVIFPSAITGVLNYRRQGLLDVRAAFYCGVFGSAFAVLGALASQWVGGPIVLLATAALILYTAGDMTMQIVRPPRPAQRPELEAGEERDAFGGPARVQGPRGVEASACDDAAAAPAPAPQQPRTPLWQLALIGALTGTYSGFLGLGGGFVLVPMLSRWLGFDIKRAIGTSLAAIALLAVPGTITHAFLGHVDWLIAASLAVGVIPGAWLGARVTLGASDRAVRAGFALMLVLVGVWLGASVLPGIMR
jgi:uncharacterized membrane protein YfcA